MAVKQQTIGLTDQMQSGIRPAPAQVGRFVTGRTLMTGAGLFALFFAFLLAVQFATPSSGRQRRILSHQDGVSDAHGRPQARF